MFAPVSEFAATFAPVKALRAIFELFTAPRLSCFDPTEFARNWTAAYAPLLSATNSAR